MAIEQITIAEYFRRYHGQESPPMASIDPAIHPEPDPDTPVMLANVTGWIRCPHPGPYEWHELERFAGDARRGVQSYLAMLRVAGL